MTTTAIWDRFEKTDPGHTKQFQRGGGFKGTAINGTYIIKKLTTEFGPCGKGWKFVIENERIEEGHTLANGDKTKVHIIRGHIDYQVDGVWYSTSPQFGQTMLVDSNKNGTFTDEEAPKKSITDCISKCAVLLGIGADVHLGLFDDHKYVNQRKQEEAAGAAQTNGNGHANGNGNGHAKNVEPLKRPVAGKPEEEAKKYVAKSEAELQGFTRIEDLRRWDDKNREWLTRLHAIDSDLHAGLTEVIAHTYRRLNTLGAG